MPFTFHDMASKPSSLHHTSLPQACASPAIRSNSLSGMFSDHQLWKHKGPSIFHMVESAGYHGGKLYCTPGLMGVAPQEAGFESGLPEPGTCHFEKPDGLFGREQGIIAAIRFVEGKVIGFDTIIVFGLYQKGHNHINHFTIFMRLNDPALVVSLSGLIPPIRRQRARQKQ
jgi:hypothetical protein